MSIKLFGMRTSTNKILLSMARRAYNNNIGSLLESSCKLTWSNLGVFRA
jgi:hypothetical protein